MRQMIFIADFIACSTCFGHHYAHHQELESIIQMAAACGVWYCKNDDDERSESLQIYVNDAEIFAAKVLQINLP